MSERIGARVGRRARAGDLDRWQHGGAARWEAA
ncbi:hypothetical protein J3R08_003060 [Micromonospora sp. HB375]|uniref:Uncharacterized protein n=1 Tax=Micromonospora echinospora TaxID=1877 RepID=A0ABR6MF06_MICEC|nr:hypothetical protein [Micromonospora echinospora]MBP1783210.1 hypothetical protein [Micromonospora sp. HB375]MDH6468081.1 hypothetical protein [Micromonospora sp. H404/HB375]